MKIVESSGLLHLYGDDMQAYDQIPAGTYDICFAKMTGFYLARRPDMSVSEKVYGVQGSKVAKVLNSFKVFNRNLGVILSGNKGIGKSLTAKMIAQEAIKQGYPVILVSQYIPGIANFIEAIDQEVMVLFDEFDKTFKATSDDNPQDTMLSLFDGTSAGKKLFVVTCNQLNGLNDYLVNRPGRFHYHFRFDYPGADEVETYLKDKLEEKYYDQIPAVVGISGGKDSSIVAALCCEALGNGRVIGVLMPQGAQSDIDVARELVAHLGIQSHEINIAETVNALLANGRAAGLCDSKQARVNLPARIRMATLFMVSQSRNGRVANTCNYSEDYVGWATLFGDGAGQFSPLGKLTVTEVKAIGRELGLPEKFIEKAPADGLTGKTDEDNFGFTYDFLDKYIRTGDFGGDTATAAKIDQMYDANVFKLLPMPVYNPDVYEVEW